ncbi:MAG: class I SAM-dependent methyltransferase [Leptospirales bacterium]
MGFGKNQTVWNTHYQTDRSKQEIPDENVVRYLHRYSKSNSVSLENIHILDLGSGSGRNLNYIRRFSPHVVGADFSHEALKGQTNVICTRSETLPFSDQSFELIIAWGLLHYLSTENAQTALLEIQRILKPGGKFFGTLRSDQDTHLQHVLAGGDLKGGAAITYSPVEIKDFFADFSNLTLGHITRQPLGEPYTVAHHMFEATR